MKNIVHKYHTLIKIEVLSAFFLLCAMLDCSRSKTVCGGGTLVENAVVRGVIYNRSGGIAAGSIVTLKTVTANPYLEVKNGSPNGIADTTDSRGRFHLVTADIGFFNLEVFYPTDLTHLLLSYIHIGGPGERITCIDTLKGTGTLSIVLPDSLLNKGEYVCIPGTSYLKTIDSTSIAAKIVIIDSVPAGKIQLIQVGNDSDSSGMVDFDDTVVVVEGDTTLINKRE